MELGATRRAGEQMTVRIGDIEFDNVSYDETGDVLYLHVGDAQPAEDAAETPEGHLIRYNSRGEIIGITLLNARWLLDRNGELAITLPLHIGADTLAPAIAH